MKTMTHPWQRAIAFFVATAMIFALTTISAHAAEDESIGRLTIEKAWEDNENEKSMRPAEVLVDIYRAVAKADIAADDDLNEGTFWKTVTLTAAESWAATVMLEVGDTDYFYRAKEQAAPESAYAADASGITKPVEQISGGLIWESPSAALPFGGAHRFSVLAFGNFKVANADVEYGLAVKGNMVTMGSYSVGATNLIRGKAATPHNPRLIVGGNLTMDGLLHVWGGDVLVSSFDNIQFGSETWNAIRVKEYIGGGSTYHIEMDGSEFQQHDWQPENHNDWVKEAPAVIDNFFVEAYTDMTALSRELKELTATDTIRVYEIDLTDAEVRAEVVMSHGSLRLPAPEAGQSRVVYNINIGAAADAPFKDVDITMPNDFDGDVVINILTDSDTFQLGWPGDGGGNTCISTTFNGTYNSGYDLAREYSDRIFWNFPNASMTTLRAVGFRFFGSVLAPYSNFVAVEVSSNPGNVNGTLVAQTVDVSATSGWETHNTAVYDAPYLGGDLAVEYVAALTLTGTLIGNDDNGDNNEDGDGGNGNNGDSDEDNGDNGDSDEDNGDNGDSDEDDDDNDDNDSGGDSGGDITTPDDDNDDNNDDNNDEDYPDDKTDDDVEDDNIEQGDNPVEESVVEQDANSDDTIRAEVISQTTGEAMQVTLVMIDEETYYVLNDLGIPLGIVHVPKGMSIEDIDILDNMVPLAEVKANPQTSDSGVASFVLTGICLMGAAAFCFYLKKRMEQA